MAATKLLLTLRARRWMRRIALLSLCALGLLEAGCIPSINYQPNERILDALGVDVARERLRETLLRVVSPRIQTMTLTDESLQYKWHPRVGTRINFINLGRVEIFENHKVLIRGAGDQVLSVLQYGTEEDAKLFADLLMGFRKRYYQRRNMLQAAMAPPPKDRHLQRVSTGSGFFINSRGDALTNQHVVADCDEIRARLATGDVHSAILMVQDRQNDLALLHFSVTPTHWLEFRNGQDAQQGEEVVAVGFPLPHDLGTGAKVTTGVVSALAGIRDDSRFLQISVPVQPGSSGGPLLDMGGNVVGVVAGKLNARRIMALTGDLPQNVNFAIKASMAKSFLDATGGTYETSASRQALSITRVSAQTRQSVIFVECWK